MTDIKLFLMENEINSWCYGNERGSISPCIYSINEKNEIELETCFDDIDVSDVNDRSQLTPKQMIKHLLSLFSDIVPEPIITKIVSLIGYDKMTQMTRDLIFYDFNEFPGLFYQMRYREMQHLANIMASPKYPNYTVFGFVCNEIENPPKGDCNVLIIEDGSLYLKDVNGNYVSHGYQFGDMIPVLIPNLVLFNSLIGEPTKTYDEKRKMGRCYDIISQ